MSYKDVDSSFDQEVHVSKELCEATILLSRSMQTRRPS